MSMKFENTAVSSERVSSGYDVSSDVIMGVRKCYVVVNMRGPRVEVR